MIQITEDLTFHLQTSQTSYIMKVLPSGHLSLLYYGRGIRQREEYPSLEQRFLGNVGLETRYSTETGPLSLFTVPLEASTSGKGDYRDPSLHVELADKTRVTDFIYHSHTLTEGKQVPEGLPHFFPGSRGCQTVTVVLEDPEARLRLHLDYSVFEESNLITRSLRVENRGGESVILHKIMSFNLDFTTSRFDVITLEGHWIREKQIQRLPLGKGKFSLGSSRLASGADHNPFLALAEPGTDEDQGNCYGFSLVYSGNHLGQVEVNAFDLCRVQMGINPFDFAWTLGSGEIFQTPEAVMTFSHRGLNGMSRNFHKGINENLIPPYWQYRERPLLFNSWEAMYFKFDQAKLLKLARAGKSLGMELFVLDDGWFKGRNDDTTSLGDWRADTKKLPGGLGGLAKKIRALGLDFGIWVEPEMVSPDSDLYRAHPEWAIRLPRRTPSLGRNQLILDLSNPEVTDYLFDEIDRVIRESGAAYVKWDMNRSVSDLHSASLAPERQKEQSHRHYLGLYGLLERLTTAHPEVLFESCASGGNRYDLGMLYYMPQTWASDNTDPGERAHIQYGSSLLYPPSTLGAHVGSNPSHQVLRSNGIESRFNIAAFGVLGYELDLTKLSHFDEKVIRNQVAFYKEHRRLLQFGEMRRIQSPFTTNHAIWLVTSEDRGKAALGYFQKIQKSSGGFESIPLKGLDKNRLYEIATRQQYMNIERFGALINDYVPFEVKTTGVGGLVHKTICDNYLFPNEVQRTVAPGDELAHAGFKLNPQFTGSDFNENIRFIGDFGSRIYLISARQDGNPGEEPPAI